MTENKFPQRMQQIEDLIAKVDTIADPDARAGARELIGLLMELHGAGLERIVEILYQAGEPAQKLMDRLSQDEVVSPLLLLYGLHPIDLESRVMSALERVRPYLKSHGGNVDLLSVSEQGDVHLRLQGSCSGCPSSSLTLKLAIEEAIFEAAPDIGRLVVEGVVDRNPAANFVPVENLKHKENAGWKEVSGLDSMNQGTVCTMEVSGRPVLFCRIAESYYAYSSNCPQCGKNLQGAFLTEATALVCPACGQKYDALRAGRGLDQPALHLQPIPLLVEHGKTRIALPAG